MASPDAHVPEQGSPPSLTERAYAYLKQRIITNTLPAGHALDDDRIAVELGFSRTPVRDAIRLLHSRGYVEVLPRKATRVAFLDIQDMRNVYQLITALEVQAVILLASRPDGKRDVAPLREAVADMQASEAGDLADWHAADERFHRAILSLSGNPRIANAAFEYRDFVQRAHLVALRLRAVTRRSTETHGELVDLVAAGDVAGAHANHFGQRSRMENDLIGAVERAGLRML